MTSPDVFEEVIQDRALLDAVFGGQLEDRRGNEYDFTAETLTEPADVTIVGGGGS